MTRTIILKRKIVGRPTCDLISFIMYTTIINRDVNETLCSKSKTKTKHT